MAINDVDLLIVTGMSGAGKTKTINTLEDLGFFCADNILPQLIEPFYKLFLEYNCGDKLAIVLDIRSGVLFDEISALLSRLDEIGIRYKLLFIDADDDVLLKRYKENRRKHPLSNGIAGESLRELIVEERKRLENIKNLADYIIDTTLTPVNQLKIRVTELFTGMKAGNSLHISCISFGYKNGLPPEADIVIDVRCLKNPFYNEDMKERTGLDKDVSDYVLNDKFSKEFLVKLLDFLCVALPSYANDGKSQVVVAVGCTGGKHRSVAVTEFLKARLSETGIMVTTAHRDMNKPNNI